MTKQKQVEQDRALDTGKACYEMVQELITDLDAASDSDNSDDFDTARERIAESSYGVGVYKTYSITLAGGGPAARITGDLDEHNEPETARLEYQDWFTPWTELEGTDEDVLLKYAREHYFHEESCR